VYGHLHFSNLPGPGKSNLYRILGKLELRLVGIWLDHK